MELLTGKAVSMRIRKGNSLRCEDGLIWATAAGCDYLLKDGDELLWKGRSVKLVLLPLSGDAVQCSLNVK